MDMNTVNKSQDATRDHICDGNSFALAVAVIRERINRLDTEDREDLYELLPEVLSDNEEDRVAAQITINEILDQKCFSVQPMPLPSSPGETLDKWVAYISKRIKTLRSEKNMTQQDLSRKSGIPQPYISRLERGEHSPSAKTIRRLATALGVEPKDLDPSAEDE